MANDRIWSQLAVDVYQPRGQRSGLSGDGYRLYDEGRDLPNGLRIQAYIDEQSREVAIGIAGTIDPRLDMPANVNFVFGGYHEQFREAVNYANEVRLQIEEQYGDNVFRFSATGHSQGGGTAQLLAHTFGWDGASFDAPPASALIASRGYQQHLSELGIEPKGPGDLVNFTERGSLTSDIPVRQYIGREVELDLTPGGTYLLGALATVLDSHSARAALGVRRIIEDQWGEDGQHNVTKFAAFFGSELDPDIRFADGQWMRPSASGYTPVTVEEAGLLDQMAAAMAARGEVVPAGWFSWRASLELTRSEAASRIAQGQTPNGDPLDEWIPAVGGTQYRWTHDTEGRLLLYAEHDGHLTETRFGRDGEVNLVLEHDTATGSHQVLFARPVESTAGTSADHLDLDVPANPNAPGWHYAPEATPIPPLLEGGGLNPAFIESFNTPLAAAEFFQSLDGLELADANALESLHLAYQRHVHDLALEAAGITGRSVAQLLDLDVPGNPNAPGYHAHPQPGEHPGTDPSAPFDLDTARAQAGLLIAQGQLRADFFEYLQREQGKALEAGLYAVHDLVGVLTSEGRAAARG